MNCLIKYSFVNNLPIEIIYMNSISKVTHRTIIVRKVNSDGVLAFDLGKQQLRTFKQANILSAAKQQRKRRYNA